MNIERLFSQKSEVVKESLIRRVFEEARDVRNPINLTIGQPDFPVPQAVKSAAVKAIEENQNGYSSNRGIDPLLAKISGHLKQTIGWDVALGKPAAGQAAQMVTMGTSGALILAAFALLDPGDEIIIPDPYFVLYPRLAELTGAKAVTCDTYPDFRMTAERVEKLITPRTKAVLFCSPSNPCGTVSSDKECRELLELCRREGVLLISDEIYDEFTYPESRIDGRCPTPATAPGAQDDMLLIRGFGKTYGFTGWRLGYCAGPAKLMERMIKLQMHLYICAPTPLQHGAIAAFDLDMSAVLERFKKRRDYAHQRLSAVTEATYPGGAFYIFAKIPEKLGMSGFEFKDAAKARRVLIVPGAAFSGRDTHFRISYAVDEKTLEEGIDVLVDLMK
jgi:aspartate/methionine/tyrosine aminotransferase